MHYVDLSWPLTSQTPIDPEDSAPQIKPIAQVEADGFTMHEITVGTHIGTHVDAPIHMLAAGKTLDQFPVERFIGRGRYIDVTDGVFSIEKLRLAKVAAGDIVLFHTGMSAKNTAPEYFRDYPAIPEGVAEYLVEQNVKMVGVDMYGPDHAPYAIHRILLGGDVLIAENLANLDKLAGKQFTVYALPLNVAVDGAPARIIAAVEE